MGVVSTGSQEALTELAHAGDNPIMVSFPHGAVFTWDHDLRYLSAGGRGLADVGLSREMLEGRTIFEVFPAETSSVIEPLYRAALRGQSTTIDVPYEGRIYSQRLAPVMDRDGTVVAGMGFTQDVTHVRAAEQALRESEERSRLTFAYAPIGQAVVELDGRWREVNPAFVKLIGYTEAELREMSFQDITHPDDLDADLAEAERLLAGEISSYQMEKRYLTASGATVWVLLAGSIVRSEDGTPLYFIAQIQDITEQKRQHQALKDLVAMLAHDLRTPLTAIAGFSELLTSGWERYADPEKLQLLRRIGAASQSMERLLQDALTVSTLEAHVLDPSAREVRIDRVINEVLDLMPSPVSSVDLSAVRPVVAWVDPDHLAQVMTNLFTNAAKYGDGNVTIAVDELPQAVRIRVIDHGPGVPAAFVPRLFDRFSRSASARSGTQRGTGLGLYIVKSLLTANNGQIGYSDTPGGGATFSVTLPKPARDPLAP